MQTSYQEQLADSRWLRKKNQILERDNYTCTQCGATSHLNVHHQYYEAGRNAWDYPNEALVTLCQNCHTSLHYKKNVDALEGINRGDWYCRWHGDFRTYAVIFDVDYATKTISLFGTNEGSWGCAWIYAVQYKDFKNLWDKVNIFKEDEDGESFVNDGYFMSGFITAFSELMGGNFLSFGVYRDDVLMYAHNYMPRYIEKTDCFREYCDVERIKYDY